MVKDTLMRIFADANDVVTDSSKGIPIKKIDGTGTGGDLKTIIISIINAVVGVLALVCVIVIIIGGVNYMTSSGDAGKVKKAKDTILYGVIGLIVCVLAFAIVNFVISNILKQS